MWPYIWMGAMFCLVVVTIVAAIRESGARKKALANMQPQPLDAGAPQGGAPADAGFGQPGQGDFASFDNNDGFQ